MRYCPVCNKRFDEDIIKFCTIDGTPLIDVEQPDFSALPSENADEDFGQETVIRRRPDSTGNAQTERIVIPTDQPEGEPREQQVRSRVAAANTAYQKQQQPPSNTSKTVILTIFGTLVLLGCGAGLFWMLQKDSTNTNVNTNAPNQNINANVGFDTNFNFNADSNFNVNSNTAFNTNFNVAFRQLNSIYK